MQPGIEVDEICPPWGLPFTSRRYILWAGVKTRFEKNWPLMEQIIKQMPLPHPFEFKVLENYAIEEYLSILDQTALMVYTGKFESFGYQLFEAWAKAVPTIYLATLWGRNSFSWLRGLPLNPEEYSADGFCHKLETFFAMNPEQQEQLGLASRDGVVRDFSIQRQGREFKMIYAQALEAKKSKNGNV